MRNSEKKGGALSGFYRKVNSSLKEVKSLFNNAIAVILESDSRGYYYYGVNDRLPNEIIEYINNSGTATACVEKLDQFTQADGFVSTFLSEKKIGTKKWNEVLSDVSMNVSYIQGGAFRLFFTNEGKIGKIETLPVQTLRRQGSIWKYNELMGEYGMSEKDTLYLKTYEPGVSFERRLSLINEQVKKYGKQVGDVHYFFKPRLGRLYSIYPVPNYYSAISDIIADGKLSEFELRNIAQGWRTAIIVSTGPVDNLNKDENEKTEQDYYDEALSEFVGEDAAPILHLKGKTNEEKPVITVLNLADLVDATEKASIRIPERVCRLMTVPPILIGMNKAGQLGNVQEMQNTMKLFQLSVINRQNLITTAFQYLKPDLPAEYQNEDFTISSLNIFDEIKKATGEEATFNEALASMSGKQHIQFKRILREVENDKLSLEAGVTLLKTSFGFSDEIARSYLEKDLQNEPVNNQK